MIAIRQKIDGIEFPFYGLSLKSYEANLALMGDRSISGEINTRQEVSEEEWMTAFVKFHGEEWYAMRPPERSKTSKQREYKYIINFYPESEKLKWVKFLDYVPGTSVKTETGLSIVSFHGNIQEFAGRLQANLDRLGQVWSVVLAPGLSEDFKQVDIDDAYIWDALRQVYDIFGVKYRFLGRTIYIGITQEVISNEFAYGKGNGLYSINRTPTDDKIISVIRGVGSDKNVPYNYYQSNARDGAFLNPDGSPKITRLAYNVQPKIFAQGSITPLVEIGTKDYYQDDAIVNQGIISEEYVIFDGSDGKEEIYPTIRGVEYNGLRIDKLRAIGEIGSSEVDKEGKAINPTFDVELNPLGFDIGSRLSSKGKAIISMLTGACSGCDFEIVKINGEEAVRKSMIVTPKSDTILWVDYNMGNDHIPGSSGFPKFDFKWQTESLKMRFPAQKYANGSEIWNWENEDEAQPYTMTVKIDWRLQLHQMFPLNDSTGAPIVYDPLKFIPAIVWDSELEEHKTIGYYRSQEIPSWSKTYTLQSGVKLDMSGQEMWPEYEITFEDAGYAGIWELIPTMSVTFSPVSGTMPSIFNNTGIYLETNYMTSFCEEYLNPGQGDIITDPDTSISVTLKKSMNDFDVLLPNDLIVPMPGDEFVLLNIDLPDSYIIAAENRVEAGLLDILNKNNFQKYNYTLEIDSKLINETAGLKDKLILGNKIKLAELSEALDINSISIKRNANQLFDTYEVDISPTSLRLSSTQKLSDKIDKIGLSSSFGIRYLTALARDNQSMSFAANAPSTGNIITSSDHNSLQGIQGGSNTQRYHLTQVQWEYIRKLIEHLKFTDDDTALYSTIEFYSEDGVSAYGIGTGSGGGGGGGYDMITDWSQYATGKETNVVSAQLLYADHLALDSKAPASHNHDSLYLKLSGGTLTGTLVGTNATFSSYVNALGFALGAYAPYGYRFYQNDSSFAFGMYGESGIYKLQAAYQGTNSYTDFTRGFRVFNTTDNYEEFYTGKGRIELTRAMNSSSELYSFDNGIKLDKAVLSFYQLSSTNGYARVLDIGAFGRTDGGYYGSNAESIIRFMYNTTASYSGGVEAARFWRGSFLLGFTGANYLDYKLAVNGGAYISGNTIIGGNFYGYGIGSFSGMVLGASFKTGNWKIIPISTTQLQIQYNDVMMAKLDSAGNILATGNITAYAV